MDPKSMGFLTDFYTNQSLILQKTNLIPHYYLWECEACNGTQISKNEDCISNGKYCAPDPDEGGPLTGADVVKEDIRQLCVYKNVEQKQWLEYLRNFFIGCILSKNVIDLEGCSKQALDKTTIDNSKIYNCYNSSFEGDKNPVVDDNTLLKDERLAFQKNKVQIWPALYLNKMPFRVSFRIIFREI